MQPAGWGYSYMDHTGGYTAAIAMLQALFHRKRTGEGQYVDLSQVEAAIALTGTAIPDYAVNGRRSVREGNRSRWPADRAARRVPLQARRRRPDRRRRLDRDRRRDGGAVARARAGDGSSGVAR